ncbi:hypothetical protein JR316_0006256 [Psilocybe cubensis]|uniref:Uncharacterized protein n=2 Tax=Psilocybe cubensis TaxID=181762 RepID=A0ACB8H3C4_PSICU|nr:hypothetical protein JR316_0006256 [Psilocybe cubensis]KAH9481729.1 hypothetical protein JR316_0006256 [Psilocybe cubensis]
MNEFTPLVKPLQSQTTIDSVAKECPSEGFNYPTFRQLAKNARLFISKPLDPDVASSYYRLFSVANSKGWFVAVKSAESGSELVFSPLDELRLASEAAKTDDETLFNPKRTVSIPTRATIVAFACGDTKLLVGLADGSVVVYDTSSLFTEGTNDVQPLGRNEIQTSPLRQVVPNPGTEPGLSDLVAIVSDGKVELLNMNLESQGGWVASDLMSQPISVDWSPKGKHIAIGLQTGDILTFAITNKSTPNKHIPPTTNSVLVSLNWLGPGHTFRTSYAAQDDSPAQHIVVLDTKSSTATYFAPDHPFISGDRVNQAAYVLNFPKWDGAENQYLTVVGDLASVDLEILGNSGNQWYRQSQENPLTLPLDKEMNDTILLALETDLTDPRYDSPIMYAYLSDGSLQGWYVEHTKPYLGMMNGKNLAAVDTNSQVPVQSQESAAPQATSAFGMSGFGQQPAQSTPAFGQTGFGQQPSSTPSAFTSTAPAFGQSSFGQPSAFGSALSSFAQPSTTTSAFGGSSSNSGGFAAFAGGSGAFGSGGGFGSGGFSSSPSTGAFGSNTTTNAFGQGGFGSAASNTPAGDSSSMTREASMSDSTPGFGGLSLGSKHTADDNAVNSMFGSFSTTSSSSQQQSTSSFGGSSLVKPATGFGAFGNLQTSSAFSSPKPATTVNAFAPAPPSAQTSTTSTASPAFGQSGFGQPAFGKPSFGAPSAFGAFGNAGSQAQKPATTTPSSGGFGAFASTPTSFGSALGSTAKPAETKPASGGFSAFASASPSAFGAAAASPKPAESKPTTGGFGAFASGGPSVFSAAAKDNASSSSSSSGGGFSAFASSAPSPFSQAANDATQKPSSGGFSAFASATPAFGVPATPKAVTDSSSTSTTPPAEPKQRTTVFGTPTGAAGSSSPSPFSASNVRSSIPKGDESPTGSPKGTSFDASPPSSPESKPAVPPVFAKRDESSPSPFGGSGSKSPSPFGQPSSPSPFGQPSSPSPSGGAFGNLQVTPSVFKPAAGFGAFGSNETPKTSAFFKKPDETPPPVSAFSQITTTPKTPVTTSATPAFGATSALGAKSVFSPAQSPSATPTKAPTTGAFSAFSGASGGFSAFAGPKTSFTDLLKSKGDEATDPIKPAATPVFSKPESESKPVVSVFATLAAMEKDKEKEKEKEKKQEDKEAEKEKDKEEPSTSSSKDGKKTIPSEPSYGNLSLSASSSGSFVEVGANDADNGELDDGEVSEDDGNHSDFLSDNFEESSYKDGDSANEESDEEDLPEERNTPSPEPPLPPSRSPSATPQPEIPSIQVSGDGADEESPSKAVPTRERSTTPPSTPVKESKAPTSSSPSLATPGAPSTSPFGIGIGRPSTRPVRSSPLANAVSAEDEEEDDVTKSPPKAKPTVSPKPVYGALPLDTKGKTKETDVGDEEATPKKSPTAKRPKTPPLLSTMGPPPTPSPFLSPPISKTSSGSSESSSIKSTASAPPLFGMGAKPAAASTPSLFGTPKAEVTPVGSWTSTTPSKPELPRANTAPAAPGTPTPSLFGGGFFAPPPPAAKAPTNAFSMPPFTLGGAAAGPAIPPAGTNLFGSKTAPGPATPTGPGIFGGKATPPPQPGGIFGMKPPTAATPGSPSNVFGGGIQPPKPSPFGNVQATPPAPPQPSPEAILEEGMQKECAALVNMVTEDLAQLPLHALKLGEAIAAAGAMAGGSRNLSDLGVQAKWSLGDLTQFKKLVLQYEAVLDEMEATHEKQKQVVHDLQSSMLKCGTRKEEIARFHKAKDDKDFAKMLKSRTLGPEHIETQTHLRKNIRAIRDRVQKLESHLQESKKKLSQAATCRPSVKAPSLDTINRTFRNIELAIDQQADEVSRLATRISKLDMAEKSSSVSRRDARLPDAAGRRVHDIIPDVAATTAAALNAERSAQRLKNALLAVRKEPLLNNTVAQAPPALYAFQTPQKSSTSSGPSKFAFKAPASGSLFSDVPTPLSASDIMPNWDLPEDNFMPMDAANLISTRSQSKQRIHSPSAQIKKTPGSGGSTPPAEFDWGPLPNFQSPPAKHMPNRFFPVSPAAK